MRPLLVFPSLEPFSKTLQVNAVSSSNPLLQDFDLPPYSAIKPEHVEPAVDQILVG